MNIKELNEFYQQLEFNAIRILHSLFDTFDVSMAYFNGHYSKNENEEIEYQYYPIPVIEVKKLCDIEIEPQQISISTKLKRKEALSFDYSCLKDFTYEVYGVEDYLMDFKASSIEEMIIKIKQSDEEEIGFSFIFESNVDEKKVFNFIKFLRQKKFYY